MLPGAQMQHWRCSRAFRRSTGGALALRRRTGGALNKPKEGAQATLIMGPQLVTQLGSSRQWGLLASLSPESPKAVLPGVPIRATICKEVGSLGLNLLDFRSPLPPAHQIRLSSLTSVTSSPPSSSS